MRILFMGTPDFALPCLQSLIDEGHNVVGVVTQTDKPKGRGYTLTPPPVKVLATQYNIPVEQPETLKNNAFLPQLESFNPDLIVVVAYGKILPKYLIDYPRYGCIDVHGSLLPKLRGAAPIQWSIINGDKKTGVTTMQMDIGIDTGDILLCSETPIGENETAGELFDRLKVIGAKTLIDTIKLLEQGKLSPVKQDDSLSTYAPMITKQTALIDFTKSALDVHNHIRGLNPFPIAWTNYQGGRLKVHKSQMCGQIKGVAGQIVDTTNGIVVCCGDGIGIRLLTIQAENSKAMTCEEYMRGHTVNLNEILK